MSGEALYLAGVEEPWTQLLTRQGVVKSLPKVVEHGRGSRVIDRTGVGVIFNARQVLPLNQGLERVHEAWAIKRGLETVAVLAEVTLHIRDAGYAHAYEMQRSTARELWVIPLAVPGLVRCAPVRIPWSERESVSVAPIATMLELLTAEQERLAAEREARREQQREANRQREAKSRAQSRKEQQRVTQRAAPTG